jgi:hypothetical protein
VLQAYDIFKELVTYYGINQIMTYIKEHSIDSWQRLWQALPFRARRTEWINVGGQLLPKNSINTLIKGIHAGAIKSWDHVHEFYMKNGELYREQKFQHAFASLLEVNKLELSNLTRKTLADS